LEPAEADTVLAVPWGPRYTAMAYGLYVTREYGGFEPVDHRGDFDVILERGDRLVTTQETFYTLPREWWADYIGQEVTLRSAGPGFVELDIQPLSETDVPFVEPVSLANGVTLLSSAVEPQGDGRYGLTLYWQADQPLDTNYSVFVHLTRSDAPAGPDDILAQADSYAPVSGWYPVTLWQPGEVVRDDYVVVVPDGYDGPLHLRAGMYRQLDDGSFENLDAVNVELR
jgi:hypothetical protein